MTLICAGISRVNWNEAGLFNDLNGAVGALHLTSPASEAFVQVYHRRFSSFHLVDSYGTGVYTSSAPVTLLVIYADLNHTCDSPF